jgi:hypothetical protein
MQQPGRSSQQNDRQILEFLLRRLYPRLGTLLAAIDVFLQYVIPSDN